MNIQIITGSMSGTADRVAMDVEDLLNDLGHEVRVNNRFSPDDLNNDDVIVLCHSNTGAGDLPDNILPLYLHLTRDYPRIAGRRYGVINLADSSYSTFNEAGILLDAAMQDLGAEKIGESLVLDASADEDTDTLVDEWVNAFHSQLS